MPFGVQFPQSPSGNRFCDVRSVNLSILRHRIGNCLVKGASYGVGKHLYICKAVFYGVENHICICRLVSYGIEKSPEHF